MVRRFCEGCGGLGVLALYIDLDPDLSLLKVDEIKAAGGRTLVLSSIDARACVFQHARLPS